MAINHSLQFVRSMRRKKLASPPGDIVFTGKQRLDAPVINLIQYNDTTYDEVSILDQKIESIQSKDSVVTWLNIDGLSDVQLMKQVADQFKVHYLIFEDVVNTSQRPKIEVFDNCIYVVLKMLSFDQESKTVVSEQVSFVLQEGILLTFQEQPGDVFEAIRERLRSHRGQIRTRGPDYLLYSLIDSIVDYYLVLMDQLENELETLEDRIFSDDSHDVSESIHRLRKEIAYLRKSVLPLQSIFRPFFKDDLELIDDSTLKYVRDVSDHAHNIVESLDVYRDIVVQLFDMHMSHLSNKMNQIMKILTVVASIFIPITFIAGVYGMNFENMPELKWPYGYPFVWGLMMSVVCGSLFYLKRRKWL